MMVELVLTRTFGNRQFTLGRLEEPKTGFKCKTMERIDPKHWKGMKNFCAIPEGSYKIRICTHPDLSFYLQLVLAGAYRNAAIGGSATPFSLPAGSIAVGTEYAKELHMLKGSDIVCQGINKWVNALFTDGHIKSFSHSGEIMLKVQYSDYYTYKDDVLVVEEKEVKRDENFDFLQ